MHFEDINVSGVWDDSRRVTPGSLFAALPGPITSGENFIPEAVEKGAAVILLQADLKQTYSVRFPQVKFKGVDDPRAAFRLAVEQFYGRPSDKVRVIGVTGTNGKTTVTYFLESVLNAAGRATGVTGTVNSRVPGRRIAAKNTTPGMLDNQIFLNDLAIREIPYLVMEVSSHALAQGRVDLINFCGAVFTNLTGDHLDYHGDMEKYFAAKSRLFLELTPKAWAVINADDPFGQRLKLFTLSRVLTYAIDGEAEVKAVIRHCSRKGASFDVIFSGGSVRIETPFTGKHNVYNILAAFAAGLGEGFSPELIKRGIEALKNVPGRLERVDCGQDFDVFIDFAHTDDGLKNVLLALQEVKHNKLILVFGCGGDRDRTKRPRMGRVACDLADHSIITSDNPRSEEPMAIINEIIPGFLIPNFEVVVDRTEGIVRALGMAEPGDIVLLAGKGHETYQILKDKTVDFIERDIIEQYFRNKD